MVWRPSSCRGSSTVGRWKKSSCGGDPSQHAAAISHDKFTGSAVVRRAHCVHGSAHPMRIVQLAYAAAYVATVVLFGLCGLALVAFGAYELWQALAPGSTADVR